MRKHPLLYHLAVRQLAMPAIHLSASTVNQPGYAVIFRPSPRIIWILCSILLLHSFTTLYGGQHTWPMNKPATALPSQQRTGTGPAPLNHAKQFSFEYDGVLRFKLVILQNPDTGLIPAIHITTTLHQPDR